jgi:hypothetical protein
MPSSTRLILVSLVLVLVWPRFAPAGMPSVSLADLPRAFRTVSEPGLTDLAIRRLEVISFFVMGLLACAGVIKWVWNGMRKDFPVLPRLSYARALGVIVLWGLLFVLVLTMISGARELMTPGAWEKRGLTYRLVETPPPPVEAEITARVEAIKRLGEHLRSYARGHGRVFPPREQAVAEADPIWRVPSPPGGRYLYLGGHLVEDRYDDGQPAPLAYEPESVGADRLVLMTDGDVRWMPATEIERVLSSKEP